MRAVLEVGLLYMSRFWYVRIGWSEVEGDKPVSEAGSTELGPPFRCVSQVDQLRIEVLLRDTYKTTEIKPIGTNSLLIINASD